MTPEERNLVTALFDKLATIEDAPRDPDAERLIRDGLRQAPNAIYALVQTVLVQDEALKQADAHIRALEGENSTSNPSSAGNTSFLGGMRDALFGRGEGRGGGSVPSVRPGGMSPAWNTGAPPMPAGPAGGAPYAPPIGALPGTGGGSFLGTAAATAAGVIGGSLLMSGIRNAMAGHGEAGHRAFEPQGGSPWGGGGGGGDSGGGSLAHQAGLDDIGRGGESSRSSEGRGFGVADDRGGDEQYDPQQEDDQYDMSDDDDDAGFDGGGDEE